jgi:hypothetical protein
MKSRVSLLLPHAEVEVARSAIAGDLQHHHTTVHASFALTQGNVPKENTQRTF